MNTESAPRILDSETLHGIDAWWRAANYRAVGQIYLLANPLLREPLALAHVKRNLLATGAPRRARTSSTRTSTASSGTTTWT